MIDAWVIVDGVQLGDSFDTWSAGDATALADLEVTWGRSTVVDQPEPSSARLTIVDRPSGNGFEDVLNVGSSIEVWASGDISTGQPVDVAVDGSFETWPLGPAAPRVVAAPAMGHTTATVNSDRAFAGTKSVAISGFRIDQTLDQVAQVPPAPFSSDPTAWDAIARMRTGQRWDWSLAVWAPWDCLARVQAIVYSGPQDQTGVAASGTNVPEVEGDGAWHVLSGFTTARVQDDNQWLGVQVRVRRTNGVSGTLDWQDTPGAWSTKSGTWVEYGTAWIDDQRILSPPSALPREVLVFAGRVTDLGVNAEDDGTMRVELIASDQLAELANRFVGDEPWTVETLEARAQRILTLAAPSALLLVDDGLASLQVTRRDVDSQPAAGLLAELAAGVDGVLWSAVHATTGAYLWIEDVTLRATIGTLTLSGGLVQIVPVSGGNRPAGQTVIDGCLLPLDDARWIRDVSDVVTRVDATWMDQSTTPDVTERNVRVIDSAAETLYGSRRHGVSTPLTSAAAATDVCERILARSGELDWRLNGLVYDLGKFVPDAGLDTANALDLLDGTTRIGRALTLTDIAYGPAGTSAAMYLDGGQYRFDGDGWELTLATTPLAGMGQSGPWTSLDPTWRWNQFETTIQWLDLYGVTGPVT